jgi:CheY-like chemotaxis protein
MAESPRHALIIEDEILTGMEMQHLLSEIGFASFAFASTARQAVDQASLRRPDLVTADIGLLDGDGVSACQAVLARCGALPIIYVTGQAAQLRGSVGLTVVEKPFGRAEIARAYQEATAQAFAT